MLGTFLTLHFARPEGGLGPSAIPISEVLAWQEAFHVQLTPWEIETILYLDRAALREMQIE